MEISLCLVILSLNSCSSTLRLSLLSSSSFSTSSTTYSSSLSTSSNTLSTSSATSPPCLSTSSTTSPPSPCQHCSQHLLLVCQHYLHLVDIVYNTIITTVTTTTARVNKRSRDPRPAGREFLSADQSVSTCDNGLCSGSIWIEENEEGCLIDHCNYLSERIKGNRTEIHLSRLL